MTMSADSGSDQEVLIEIERVARSAGWVLDAVELYRPVVSGEQTLAYRRFGASEARSQSDDDG